MCIEDVVCSSLGLNELTNANLNVEKPWPKVQHAFIVKRQIPHNKIEGIMREETLVCDIVILLAGHVPCREGDGRATTLAKWLK
jgi:hypothetical protein